MNKIKIYFILFFRISEQEKLENYEKNLDNDFHNVSSSQIKGDHDQFNYLSKKNKNKNEKNYLHFNLNK